MQAQTNLQDTAIKTNGYERYLPATPSNLTNHRMPILHAVSTLSHAIAPQVMQNLTTSFPTTNFTEPHHLPHSIPQPHQTDDRWSKRSDQQKTIQLAKQYLPYIQDHLFADLQQLHMTAPSYATFNRTLGSMGKILLALNEWEEYDTVSNLTHAIRACLQHCHASKGAGYIDPITIGTLLKHVSILSREIAGVEDLLATIKGHAGNLSWLTLTEKETREVLQALETSKHTPANNNPIQAGDLDRAMKSLQKMPQRKSTQGLFPKMLLMHYRIVGLDAQGYDKPDAMQWLTGLAADLHGALNKEKGVDNLPGNEFTLLVQRRQLHIAHDLIPALNRLKADEMTTSSFNRLMGYVSALFPILNQEKFGDLLPRLVQALSRHIDPLKNPDSAIRLSLLTTANMVFNFNQIDRQIEGQEHLLHCLLHGLKSNEASRLLAPWAIGMMMAGIQHMQANEMVVALINYISDHLNAEDCHSLRNTDLCQVMLGIANKSNVAPVFAKVIDGINKHLQKTPQRRLTSRQISECLYSLRQQEATPGTLRFIRYINQMLARSYVPMMINTDIPDAVYGLNRMPPSVETNALLRNFCQSLEIQGADTYTAVEIGKIMFGLSNIGATAESMKLLRLATASNKLLHATMDDQLQVTSLLSRIKTLEIGELNLIASRI